jgi:hypothetical protein
MIESILEEPLALGCHRTAPLLREREQFLSHLLRQGTSRRRVRSIAAYLIHIVRLMELTSLRDWESRRVLVELSRAGPEKESGQNSGLLFFRDRQEMVPISRSIDS